MVLEVGNFVKIINKQSIHFNKFGVITSISKHMSHPFLAKKKELPFSYIVNFYNGGEEEFLAIDLIRTTRQQYIDDY